MANTRTAKKQIRVSERKRLRNRAVRSSVRTRVTHTRRALAGTEAALIQHELSLAVQALDQAAQKGILHKNNVARRKARLMVQVHRRLLALESAPAAEQAETAKKVAKAKTAKAAPAKPAAKKTAKAASK